MVSIHSYGEDPPWSISYQPPGSLMPITSTVDIKEGVLIGPFIISSIMSGDVTFTSPTGETQNLAVRMGEDGFSADIGLNELGIYKVSESYELTINLAFGSIVIQSRDFSKTHEWDYDNQSMGIKTFNVTSTLSGFSADIQGYLEVYSVVPPSVEPGAQEVSFMLRSLSDVKKDQILANSITLNGLWDKLSTVTTNNVPPSISIVSATQASPNTDVKITFSLQDAENALCILEAQYKLSTEASWTSAVLSDPYANPGTNTLYWKATRDQPNGSGNYNLRMRASDGLSYSVWSTSRNFSINNTAVVDNNPPSAANVRIGTIDATTGVLVSRNPITGDKLQAIYDFYDPDPEDDERNSSLKWYKNGILQKSVTVSGASDPNRMLPDPVRKGDRWNFTITPSDGKISGITRESSVVTIGNAPPRMGYVRITPSSPTAKDDLKIDYDYSDPEDDPEGNHEVRWYKDGITQSIYNDQQTLPAFATVRGDRWKVIVRPRDIDGATGGQVESAAILIKNQKPFVEITSVSVEENSGDVTVIYNLVDNDEDLCKLSIWYQGGSAGIAKVSAHIAEANENINIINDVVPGNGLSFTWESIKDQPSGKADNFRIGVKPHDGFEDGNEALSDSFSIDNNNAPNASQVAISPLSPFSSDDLIASYEFSDADNDSEVNSEIRWYKNGSEQISYKNQKTLPSIATRRDENWYFTVKPNDGKELGQMQTSPTVKIGNSPPQALEVKLEPANALSEDNLEAFYEYDDADEDPEAGTQIKWYMNDLLQSQYNNQKIIPSTATIKGQTWYFTVQPSDGTVEGTLVESNRVKLGNVPPLVRDLSVPSDGFQSVPIKFDLVDADGDECSVAVEYRGGLASDWTRATIKESITEIPSNDLITLTWLSTQDEVVDRPTKFQVRITPNDGLTDGDTVESVFFTLDNNVPPVASDLRISPPEPKTTDNLTASYDFSDPDGDSEGGSEIIWYKNDEQTNFKSRTLLASATSKGQTWHFSLKPKDGAKFGETYISDPITILNTPPSVRNPIIIPTEPKSGDFLTVRYDYVDLDQDRESGTEIEWYKNGMLELEKVVVADEDKSLPSPVLKGQRWYVVIRPKDGTNFGTPVTSPSVAIDNALPSVSDVTVSVGAGDATVTYNLVDDDGDLCDLKVEYQGGSMGTAWTPANVRESTTQVAPGIGLNLTWLSRIDEPGQKASNYRIRIVPNDGVSDGIIGISPTFSLGNNAVPTAVEISILPDEPITSDNLQVSYTFVDPDGDKEAKPEIRWYKNSLPQAMYNDSTLVTSNATTKGDRWYYTIKVNDGKEYGRMQVSPDVVVKNAPPDATGVSLTPDQPQLNQQLTAHYVYVDADGDPESGTEIKWYRNGALLPGYDNFTIIPSVAVSSGDEWYFTVIPSDGTDFGVPKLSNKVYVSNTPPSASSLSISPVNPSTADDLVASYIYIDPENDPEEGSKIVWYKNSTPQTKYNDMLVLPSRATIKSQVWHFTVQPKDGKQFGAMQQSNFVVIKNTPPRVENLAITPRYPLSKDDLVASYDFIDVDGDVESRSDVWWYRNDIRMRAFDGLKRLPGKETLDGEIWYFTVRPRDGMDFGELMTSPSVEVGSSVPRVNNLVIMPTTPVTTDALAANYFYNDPKGIPESGSQITWYKNGVAQTEYNDLKILPPEATSKGEQWYFTIRPSNGSLFGEEQASSPVTIINSPPTLTDVVPRPDKPTTDDDLAVSYIFSDPDGDPEVSNEIKWFRDNILQPAYNGITELPASVTRRNERWYFTIRSMDGTAFSELASSVAVVIGNGIPKVNNVQILPINPVSSDDLRLGYNYIDTEGDLEAGTEIRWFKNGNHQPDYNDLKTIPANATARDDQWYCTVRPRDGIDLGELVSSNTLTVVNTPPIAVEILTEAEQVLRGASVSIVSYGQDIDRADAGAALQCQTEYRIGASPWTRILTDYVEIPSARWEAVFTPDTNAQLGEYDFRVRFVDSAGGESDWIRREKLVAVINNPPVIKSNADNFHVPEDTVSEFDLRNYGTDPEDGIALTWNLDSDSVDDELFRASILSNRFLEIVPVNNKNGQGDITLTLTDTDGEETVKTDITIIIDPINDPPTIPTIVQITPQSPRTLDNLMCEVEGSVDVDQNDVVYRFQWYKNGEMQTGLNKRNIPYDRTSKGDIWQCEVTPSDGISDGPSRTAEVTIINSVPEVNLRKVTGNVDKITVNFDLTDADSDDCDMKVEYRIRGRSWNSATVAESLRGVKPGAGLNITWQSNEDEGDTFTDDCEIRITANDGEQISAAKESESFLLDNKEPELTVKAVANPIHPLYIDVSVVSDEELIAIPDVSASIGGGQPLDIDMQTIADTAWTGKLMLEQGFDGVVLFTAEGVDLVGNAGNMELQKAFQIPDALPKPSDFALEQNYPNPFRKSTSIPYQLAESRIVTIRIYNLTGRLVRTMELGYKVAGFYLSRDKAEIWDGRDDYGNMVASGVYYYHLKAGDFEDIKKMSIDR
jgi:hypothetical protein